MTILLQIPHSTCGPEVYVFSRSMPVALKVHVFSRRMFVVPEVYVFSWSMIVAPTGFLFVYIHGRRIVLWRASFDAELLELEWSLGMFSKYEYKHSNNNEKLLVFQYFAESLHLGASCAWASGGHAYKDDKKRGVIVICYVATCFITTAVKKQSHKFAPRPPG